MMNQNLKFFQVCGYDTPITIMYQSLISQKRLNLVAVDLFFECFIRLQQNPKMEKTKLQLGE